MTAGNDHGPPPDQTFEREAVAARNARYGLALFLLYLLFYGGFVLVNAFAPELMDLVLAGGVNLAIWYGFALIGAALALALVYAWLSRDPRTHGEGRP